MDSWGSQQGNLDNKGLRKGKEFEMYIKQFIVSINVY